MSLESDQHLTRLFTWAMRVVARAIGLGIVAGILGALLSALVVGGAAPIGVGLFVGMVALAVGLYVPTAPAPTHRPDHASL